MHLYKLKMLSTRDGQKERNMLVKFIDIKAPSKHESRMDEAFTPKLMSGSKKIEP